VQISWQFCHVTCNQKHAQLLLGCLHHRYSASHLLFSNITSQQLLILYRIWKAPFMKHVNLLKNIFLTIWLSYTINNIHNFCLSMEFHMAPCTKRYDRKPQEYHNVTCRWGACSQSSLVLSWQRIRKSHTVTSNHTQILVSFTQPNSFLAIILNHIQLPTLSILCCNCQLRRLDSILCCNCQLRN
jgi:hypothetical protein